MKTADFFLHVGDQFVESLLVIRSLQQNCISGQRMLNWPVRFCQYDLIVPSINVFINEWWEYVYLDIFLQLQEWVPCNYEHKKIMGYCVLIGTDQEIVN